MNNPNFEMVSVAVRLMIRDTATLTFAAANRSAARVAVVEGWARLLATAKGNCEEALAILEKADTGVGVILGREAVGPFGEDFGSERSLWELERREELAAQAFDEREWM